MQNLSTFDIQAVRRHPVCSGTERRECFLSGEAEDRLIGELNTVSNRFLFRKRKFLALTRFARSQKDKDNDKMATYMKLG